MKIESFEISDLSPEDRDLIENPTRKARRRFSERIESILERGDIVQIDGVENLHGSWFPVETRALRCWSFHVHSNLGETIGDHQDYLGIAYSQKRENENRVRQTHVTSWSEELATFLSDTIRSTLGSCQPDFEAVKSFGEFGIVNTQEMRRNCGRFCSVVQNILEGTNIEWRQFNWMHDFLASVSGDSTVETNYVRALFPNASENFFTEIRNLWNRINDYLVEHSQALEYIRGRVFLLPRQNIHSASPFQANSQREREDQSNDLSNAWFRSPESRESAWEPSF